MSLTTKILLVFTLSVHLLSAQTNEEVLTLSLKEAQEMAISNSKDVVLSQIEIDKAHAQVRQALAALLPQVNANLSYTQYGKLPSTIFPNTQALQVNQIYSLIENQFEQLGSPLPAPISTDPSEIEEEIAIQFGSKFNVNAEIMATQTVFNGVFLVGIKAANAFISIVEHQKQLTEEQILDNIKRSYYQVLAAQENIKVLEDNLSNIQKLKDDTKALFDNGFTEEIDVDRLQLSINNIQTQLDQAQRQINLTEIVLKFQMGIDVYTKIELVGSLEDYMQDIQYDFAKKGDFSNRTEISFFNVREKVNEYNVKRYKSAYYPSITLFGSLGSSAQRDNFSFFRFTDNHPWFNQRYFGFEVNIPIWDSFGKKGQIQYAQLDVDRIQAEREKFFNSLDLQYETSKESMIKAKEQLDFADKNIELAEKIYNVTQIKYKEGVGSSIEMTNAERDLYTAQANRLMAVYNLLIAKADLDKTLGNY
ncbi:MAG: TolC family protein [Chitinophagales bacterium]